MALGIAASQPDRRARAVRLDDEAVSRRRRGARGPHVGAAGEARLHRLGARARSAARAHADVLDQVRLDARSPTRSATRFEISFNTYKPFACGIVIHPVHRRLRAARAPRIGLPPRDIERIELKVHPLVLELTGKTRAAHRPRGQVQRLPRVRGGHRVRQGGRGGIRRRRRGARRHGRAARSHPRDGRRRDRRSVGRRDDRLHATAAGCTRSSAHADRQPRAADDRRRPRAQVPRPRRPGARRRARSTALLGACATLAACADVRTFVAQTRA